MELPREPVFYPRTKGISIEINSKTEETLQSIDSTLKRIEAILLQLQNQSFVLDVQGRLLQTLKENLVDLHAE